jgi:Protein of unknown function (DUF3435)
MIRKIFVQTEVDDLIFDLIILMITLAILNDVFESSIQSVEDVFRIRVLLPRRSLQLRFKESMYNVPIFRKGVQSISGFWTSLMKALSYRNFLYYLQRLGMATGMMQLLQPYQLRRGTGNEIDGMYQLSAAFLNLMATSY